MLTEGAVLHAGYRLLDRIAQGEIGEVYKAERVASGELCALKVLSPELMNDSLLVERFTQEAKRACTFRHPNAVRTEEAGEAEDGRPFVVMEYLPGEDLRQVMAREGRLPASRACYIARHVATVLQVAHAWGIVHQDVTPGHIMVVGAPAGPHVSLLGCCLARIKEDHRCDIGGMALTRHGGLMGTPEYFSPEMAVGRRGNELDGRSDLYSLGVVLYQMLCGQLPLQSKSSTMDTLLAHLLVPPKPVSEVCPDLPGELGSLVMKMLEKKPESRPADGRVVVEELEKVESLLCQTSAMAAEGASQARADVAEVLLSGTAPPAVVPGPRRDGVTPPPDSPPQAAGELVGIRFGTAKPKAPALPLGYRAARPRGWRRKAAITAITALLLVFVAWFLAPLRSKLTPYFERPHSASGTNFPASASRPGQTSRSTGMPPPQPSGPPATTPSRETVTVPQVPASPQAGTGPVAKALQNQGTDREQAAGKGAPASEANRAERRPSVELATLRALTAEGDAFLRRGEYDRAIRSYSRALRLNPASPALRARIERARSAKAAEEKYLNN
jgi:serine/threonine protein kinase